MKTLKFASNLVPLIVSGKKTSTWRLFDDKNLSLEDVLEFQNSENGKIFGRAKIIAVYEKKLSEINESDYAGHEQFKSKSEMVNTYKNYYGDKVNEDSLVKIISFVFSKL